MQILAVVAPRHLAKQLRESMLEAIEHLAHQRPMFDQRFRIEIRRPFVHQAFAHPAPMLPVCAAAKVPLGIKIAKRLRPASADPPRLAICKQRWRFIATRFGVELLQLLAIVAKAKLDFLGRRKRQVVRISTAARSIHPARAYAASAFRGDHGRIIVAGMGRPIRQVRRQLIKPQRRFRRILHAGVGRVHLGK